MLGIQGENGKGNNESMINLLSRVTCCASFYFWRVKKFGWYRRKGKGGAAYLPSSVRESIVCPVYITGGETLRRAICNWGSSGLTTSTTLPYYYYYRERVQVVSI
jgi:hypothetical protein